MSLTRNLYREDEVIAAMRLSIVRGRSSEAVFWVQEGIESGMDVVVLQTLLRIWLYNVGTGNLSWLSWFLSGLQEETPFTEKTIIALTVSLVNSIKSSGDSTVFAILAIGLEEGSNSERVAFSILPPSLRTTLTKHETNFYRAVQQGKFVLAWNLARPLWETGQAARILETFDSPQFSLEILGSLFSEHFLWDFRALSLVIANKKGCLHETIDPFPRTDPTILNQWNERAAMPMRYRRILSVPTECLYSYTHRGSLKTNQTTDADLRHNLERVLSSSNFWAEFQPDIADSGLRREQFYDAYFPTDIPDEWSLADRAKSHGHGVVPNQPHDSSVILKRTLRLFHRVPSKGIWCGVERAIDVLVSRNTNEQVFHQFYSGPYDPPKQSVWDMSAMKKELYGI